MNDYLTFEQASEFLSAPRSTLYRWVREGRVPGHKIGRQWRFLRSELETVLRGDTVLDDFTHLEQLAELLHAPGAAPMLDNWKTPDAIAESLVWDAVDKGAQVIHLTPTGDGHDIAYRKEGGLEQLIHLPQEAFAALDDAWQAASRGANTPHRRRMYLEREAGEETDRLQVRYQRLETLTGPRLTLRLYRENKFPGFSEIAPNAEDSERLKSFCGRSHGLVLVAGRGGSGKTTTAYVCLDHLAKRGDMAIFTIEEPDSLYLLPGVNQVEVDLDDERAYREAFAAIFESDMDVLFIGSTYAQRHRQTIWGTALTAAESGHLVFVQLEADSAEDALEKFRSAVDRPFDDHLVGAVWQELVRDDEGKRSAAYEFVRGPLDA